MRVAASPITLGARLSSQDAGGFLFTQTSHEPGARLACHFHERANITFIVEGAYSERCARRTINGGPRSLLFKPAGELHSDEYGPRGMRGLVIEIPPARLASLGPASAALERVQFMSEGPATWLAGRLVAEITSPDAVSPLAIEALTLELILHAARQDFARLRETPPRWMPRVLDALRARFREPFSLTSLAEIAGLHPVHFAREFRRHRGCTAGEYQRALRVEAAARMLAESELPLLDIAAEAGFSDQSVQDALAMGRLRSGHVREQPPADRCDRPRADFPSDSRFGEDPGPAGSVRRAAGGGTPAAVLTMGPEGHARLLGRRPP